MFNQNKRIYNGLTLRHILRGHKDKIQQIVWSPNGEKLASYSNDLTIIIWNQNSENSISTIIEQNDSIRGITWSFSKDLRIGSICWGK